MTNRPLRSPAHLATRLCSRVGQSLGQRRWSYAPRLSRRATSRHSESTVTITLEKGSGFAGGAAFRVTVTVAGRTVLEYTCDLRDLRDLRDVCDVCGQHPDVVTEHFVASENSGSVRSTLSGARAAETPPLSPLDDTSATLTLFFAEVSGVIITALKQSGLTAVPAPTSLSLFALGLAGLATLRGFPPAAEAGQASPTVPGDSVERTGDDARLKPFGTATAIAGDPARATRPPHH